MSWPITNGTSIHCQDAMTVCMVLPRALLSGLVARRALGLVGVTITTKAQAEGGIVAVIDRRAAAISTKVLW